MNRLLSLLLLTAAGLPAACVTDNSDPGCVHFAMWTDSSFHAYVESPSSSMRNWLNSNFYRMVVSSSYFDSRLSWYRDAWAYTKYWAIARNDSAMISQHSDWIMHDSGGHRLYIDWGCGGGSCPQYAADFTNSGYRNWWINKTRALLAKGYKGIWLDNVDLEMRSCDGNGNTKAPIDPATRSPMTETAWERYMANFLTQIRQAFPNVEIVHNVLWFAGSGTPGTDTYIKQEIKAANWINLQRGFGDPNVTGDGGQWSLQARMDYVDRVHALGPKVWLQNASFDGGEYIVAGYFLISNGKDLLGNDDVTPNNWPDYYDVEIGNPSGRRYDWKGLIRRDFFNGVVLLNPPGKGKVTVSLGRTYRDYTGKTFSSVTLSGKQGKVLIGTPSTGGGGDVSAVRINVCGRAVGNFGSDQWADGGHCNDVGSRIDTSNVNSAAPESVYQTKRTSDEGDSGFSYTIPNLVKGHGYHVRLDFADDISTDNGHRRFDVYINGNRVLNDFDIYDEANARRRAVAKDFYGIEPNSRGDIVIEFRDQNKNALVSGISILP